MAKLRTRGRQDTQQRTRLQMRRGGGAAGTVRTTDVGDSNPPSFSFRLQGYVRGRQHFKVKLPSSCKSKAMLGLPQAISKSATPVCSWYKGRTARDPTRSNLFLTSSHSCQAEDWAPLSIPSLLHPSCLGHWIILFRLGVSLSPPPKNKQASLCPKSPSCYRWPHSSSSWEKLIKRVAAKAFSTILSPPPHSSFSFPFQYHFPGVQATIHFCCCQIH